MLTDFGKLLRKIRIDHGEIIKDMADKLGVTASYLSAIENGKRNIPENWVDEISQLYQLDNIATEQLKNTILTSAKSLKLDIENLTKKKRNSYIIC